MKLPSVFYQLLAVSLLISPTLYATTREGEMPKMGTVQQRLAELRKASGQNLPILVGISKQHELNEALCDAADELDLDCVVSLLKQGADANYLVKKHEQMIREKGCGDRILKKLIDRVEKGGGGLGESFAIDIELLVFGAHMENNWKMLGVNPEVINMFATALRNGYAQLHLAALFGGNTNALKKLIAIHPELVNSKNRFGDTPLRVALAVHNCRHIAMLLAAGATLDADMLRYSQAHETLECKLLRSPFATFGKNPQDFLSQQHEQSLLNELLHYSVLAGRIDLVQVLLNHGADDTDLLRMAVESKDLEMIHFVLGLTPCCVNTQQRNELYYNSPLSMQSALTTLKLLISDKWQSAAQQQEDYEMALDLQNALLLEKQQAEAQSAAPEINSSAAHAAAHAPAHVNPQILEDREICEQQDRDYEEAVEIDTAIAASLAEQAEAQPAAPVELVAGNEDAAEPTPSPEELRAIQLQAIEKRS